MAKKQENQTPISPEASAVISMNGETKAAEARETKRERFRRVGNRRSKELLDAFEAFAALSNRSTYEWEASKVDAFFALLQNKLDTYRARFSADPMAVKTTDGPF